MVFSLLVLILQSVHLQTRKCHCWILIEMCILYAHINPTCLKDFKLIWSFIDIQTVKFGYVGDVLSIYKSLHLITCRWHKCQKAFIVCRWRHDRLTLWMNHKHLYIIFDFDMYIWICTPTVIRFIFIFLINLSHFWDWVHLIFAPYS